jgi:beta-phosphoglucomutase-like phosphatase (HAD superfamily)
MARYGNGPVPFVEDQPLNPVDPYGIAKYASELVVRNVCELHGIEPRSALFVEDMARNLKPAKALGMATVWVDNGSERGNHDAEPGHIDVTIADVGEWLEELLGEES